MHKFCLIISLLSVYQLCSRAAVVPGNQAASSSPQISVLETKTDRSKAGYSPTTTELLEKLAAQLQEEEQADIESLYITLKKKTKDENIPLQIVDAEYSFRRSAEETFLQQITAIRSAGETSRLNKDLCEGQTDSVTIDTSQNDVTKFNAVCELIFKDPYFANKGIHVDSQSVSAAAPICRENTIKLSSSGDTVSETILMFPCSYYSEAAGRGTFWIFQNPENSSFFITEEASALSQVKFLTCIFISEIDLINVLVIIEKSKQSTAFSSDSVFEASAGSSGGTDSSVVESMTPLLLSDVSDFKLDSEFAVAANSAAVEENVKDSTAAPAYEDASGVDLAVTAPSPAVAVVDLPVTAPSPAVAVVDLPVTAPSPGAAVVDLKITDSKKESDQTADNSGLSNKSNAVRLPSRRVGMTAGQRRQAAKDIVRQKAEEFYATSAKPVQPSHQKAIQVSGQSAKQLASSQQEVKYVKSGATSQDAMSVLQYIIEIIRNNYEQTQQLWWNTKLYDLLTYISQSTSNSPIYNNILRIINSKSFSVSELVEYIKSLFSNKKLMLEVDEFVKKYNESSFYSRAFQQIRNWFGFDCYYNKSNNNHKGCICNNNNNGNGPPTRPLHDRSKQLSLSSDGGKCGGRQKSWGQRDTYQERTRSRSPLAPDGPLFSVIQKTTDCYASVKQKMHQMLKCPTRKQPSYPYKQEADHLYSSINQCEKEGSCNKYIANYEFEEIPVVGMDVRVNTDTVISIEQTTSDVYSSVSQEVILVLKCAYWCDGIISVKLITDDTYDWVEQKVYVYMFCPIGSSPLVAVQRQSTDAYSSVKQESKHYVYYTNDAELYGGDCSF